MKANRIFLVLVALVLAIVFISGSALALPKERRRKA